MSRINWNRGKSGGSSVSSLSSEASGYVAWSRGRPDYRRSAPTTEKGKKKRLFQLAEAQMQAKKGLKIHYAIFGKIKRVPDGVIRLSRKDPVTNLVNTLDIPIKGMQGGLTKILDKIAKHKPVNVKEFGITKAQLEFITTGRWDGDVTTSSRRADGSTA